MTSEQVQLAQQYATAASDAIARMKPGSWDSGQTLALISIAHSLSVLAAASDQR